MLSEESLQWAAFWLGWAGYWVHRMDDVKGLRYVPPERSKRFALNNFDRAIRSLKR